MYLVQFCHYQRMPENAFLPNTKIQDLHRSLVENLGFGNILPIPRSKIQDFSTGVLWKSWILENCSKSQSSISKILARSLVGILDLGSWYFQDFSQESCGNLGSWYFQDFSQESCGNLGSWYFQDLARSLVGILDLGLSFQDFSQESCGNLGSWILVLIKNAF